MSEQSTDNSPAHVEQAMHERRSIPAWLVLPGVLALVLVGILAGRMLRPPEVREGGLADGGTEADAWIPSPRPQGPSFSLTIQFGNGAEKRFAAISHREGMTVLEAMRKAAAFRPGITFDYRGDGETAFLTAIDGLKNAGGGGGNWIYEINGEKVPVGIGLATLQPGDALLWRYAMPE